MDMKSGNATTGKAVDEPNICKKREYTSIASKWRDQASYRDTQQNTWMVSRILHVLASRRSRYLAEPLKVSEIDTKVILYGKNPRDFGNISIHENFRDAVKFTCNDCHQGQGYAYIPSQKGLDKDPLICNYVLNSETNANGVKSVEHRCRRHRHLQRHGGLRNNRNI